jgi:hypothetical protein
MDASALGQLYSNSVTNLERLDTADIVRDGDFSPIDEKGPWLEGAAVGLPL